MPEWGGQTKSLHIDINTGIGWSTCPEFADKSISKIKEEVLDINVIKTDTKDIHKLAQRGGVLNCISWVY